MRVESTKYKEHSCLNEALAQLLKKHENDTRWLVLNNFSIEYSDKLSSNLIYKKLRFRQVVHYTEFCGIIFGMHFEEMILDEKLFETMQHQLKEGKAVLVGFDFYYAPWNEAYEKTHIFHYILVNEIKGDVLICTDAFMDNLQVFWNKELFLKAVKTGYYVQVPEKMSGVAPNQVLGVVAQNMSEQSIRDNYEALIQDLKNIQSMEQLFECDEPGTCELIVMIKRIILNYEKIAQLFNLLDMKGKEKDMTTLCREIQYQWELIINVLLRMHVRKKYKEADINAMVGILEGNIVREIKMYQFLHGLEIKE